MRHATRSRSALAAAAAVLGWGVGAVTVAGGATAQATAASISDVGWWSSNPAASAPEGGLAVSAGPSGNVTIAAVRVLLSADRIDTARLSLTEEGGLQAQGAALRVCPTPNAWSSGPKQPMDKAPKAECDQGKADLSRSPEGVWTAEVSSLLVDGDDDGEVSLMVVPAGAGAVPVGFEVRFQRPALEATGTSDDAGGGSGSSVDTSEFGSSNRAGGGSGSAETATGSFGSPGSFDPSSASSPAATAVGMPSFSPAQTAGTFESSPTAADTSAAASVAPAGEGSTVLANARPALVGGRPSRYGQGLFFVLVSLAVAVAVGVGHARLRPGSG